MLRLGKTLELIAPLIEYPLAQSERVNSYPRKIHYQHATATERSNGYRSYILDISYAWSTCRDPFWEYKELGNRAVI